MNNKLTEEEQLARAMSLLHSFIEAANARAALEPIQLAPPPYRSIMEDIFYPSSEETESPSNAPPFIPKLVVSRDGSIPPVIKEPSIEIDRYEAEEYYTLIYPYTLIEKFEYMTKMNVLWYCFRTKASGKENRAKRRNYRTQSFSLARTKMMTIFDKYRGSDFNIMFKWGVRKSDFFVMNINSVYAFNEYMDDPQPSENLFQAIYLNLLKLHVIFHRDERMRFAFIFHSGEKGIHIYIESGLAYDTSKMMLRIDEFCGWSPTPDASRIFNEKWNGQFLPESDSKERNLNMPYSIHVDGKHINSFICMLNIHGRDLGDQIREELACFQPIRFGDNDRIRENIKKFYNVFV